MPFRSAAPQPIDFASAAGLPPVEGQAVFLGRIDYGVAWTPRQRGAEERQQNGLPDALRLC